MSTPPSIESVTGPCNDIRLMQHTGTVKDVGIVLYDGFPLLAAGMLAEALHVANELQCEGSKGGLTYRVNLISAHGGTVSCSSSMSVWTEQPGAQAFDRLDTLFVAGGNGVARASADASFIDLLRRLCAKSATITAIGNGNVLLSAAGVRQTNLLPAKGEPFIGSRPAPIPDQALMSSLALLKKDLGREMAVRVADRVGSGADIALAADFEETQTATLAKKVSASARWLLQNCAKPISVVDAARMSSMSERNFVRLFKREIGVTPSRYLLRARLDLTCKLLASSELPVDKIARSTGLSNGERLSKLFRKEFSMSPTEFRTQSRQNY
ncbi:AraC family transcriptional regulator [Caballeronia catudaia]|uniref:AraC family transcriptional regulator n=1 Tax=Caballeronia catudaia TaxID=1777136 RepID=A0A157ZSE2_9BURK|nr:helix-turn-helix domain-containing protein [Caballeronia catudaia]SAK48438.1 AraC family transcriptional regulator [Caballeronia catudaia]